MTMWQRSSHGHQVHPQRPPISVDLDGATPLLTLLRSELGLTAAKYGCGTEKCGACMVLIDDEPTYSCTREVGTLAGRTVTTLEAWDAMARCTRCSRR